MKKQLPQKIKKTKPSGITTLRRVRLQRSFSLVIFSLALFSLVLIVFLVTVLSLSTLYAQEALPPSPASQRQVQAPAFVTLTNTFVENGVAQEETIIVPQQIYRERSRVIHVINQNPFLNITLREKTLLSINLTKLGENISLRYRNRRYIREFHVFIRNQEQTFPLIRRSRSATEANAPLSANDRVEYIEAIRVFIDKAGPEADLIPPPSAIKIANPQQRQFLDFTPWIGKTLERQTPLYVFPPNATLSVLLRDHKTALQRAQVEIHSLYCSQVGGWSQAQNLATCEPQQIFWDDLRFGSEPTQHTARELLQLPLLATHHYIELILEDILGNQTPTANLQASRTEESLGNDKPLATISFAVVIDDQPPVTQAYIRKAQTIKTNTTATQNKPDELPAMQKLPIDQTNIYFDEEIEVLLRAEDLFSKEIKIYTALTSLSTNEEASMSDEPSQPVQPTSLQSSARLEDILLTEVAFPLTLTNSQSLFYTSQDHFGNASPLAALHFIRSTRPRVEDSISVD